MIETLTQDFHYTSQFLDNRFNGNLRGVVGQQLLLDLLKNLQLDGFDLPNDCNYQNRQLSSSFHREEVEDEVFFFNLTCVLVCVLCAGLASGLTQGLLSLDVLQMSIKVQSGTPKEKEYAAKILPLIRPHHLLLVTLMLWNACATEALPIFLNALVPEYIAVIISVTLVLIFGEIIPASILTGPRQLQITSALSPLVYVVFFVFFPIAYPIAKLLDWIIGHEEGLELYNKGEIAALMRMQHEEAERRSKSGELLRDVVDNEEVMIIGGALKFREMKVADVMTPLDQCFMLSVHDSLSYKTMYEIFQAGYSRIPIYDKDKNDIIGLLLAKDLIFIDPEDETPVSNFVEFFGRRPVMVWHDQLLGETLTNFRQERAHLAMVRDVFVEGDRDPVYVVTGIITLEDIIEEILGTEIEDEFDYEDDNNVALAACNDIRDMDLARLKSLRSKVTDDSLSSDEIEAIVTFLRRQIPHLSQLLNGENLFLKDLVAHSQVFVLRRQTSETAVKPRHNDIIVRRGRATNTCILILQGKVRLLYDYSDGSAATVVTRESSDVSSIEDEEDEQVLVTHVKHEEVLGPWSLICAEALTSEENTFIPQFTAFIHSSDLRIVRIPNYHQYQHQHSSNPIQNGGVGGGGGKIRRDSRLVASKSEATPLLT